MKNWIIYTEDGNSYLASQKEVKAIAKTQSTAYKGSNITSMVREDCDCCISLMEKYTKPKRIKKLN